MSEMPSASNPLSTRQLRGAALAAFAAVAFLVASHLCDYYLYGLVFPRLRSPVSPIDLVVEGMLLVALGIITVGVHRSHLALRELNAGLERRVRQRTEQLELANCELEAFSYSVSHDLRAPLRRIEGFTDLLERNSGKGFSSEQADHLRRIRGAASRMNQLIEDLLALSRVTRQALSRAPVDLSGLASAVAGELRQAQPERVLALSIEPGLRARADPGLTRAIYENLLGNAWKFTAKTQDARIEVGALPKGGERAFFVRDNGAGFDMRYADRLFGAFQRLHDAREFEGTGVGLATVQRIVHRHGGRIWAEAAVGKGASFYFTLPEEPRE